MGSSKSVRRSVVAALAWGVAGLVLAGEAPPPQAVPFDGAIPAAFASSVPADRGVRLESSLPGQKIDRVGTSFLSSPLLGRISRKMERSGSIAELRVLADRRMSGAAPELEATAVDRLSRVGQGALKSALLDWAEDETNLDHVLDTLSTSTRAEGSATTGIRYDVGVSDFLPRLGMRLPTDVATRLTFGATGRFGVDLAPGASGRTLLHAGYDMRSRTTELRALLRF